MISAILIFFSLSSPFNMLYIFILPRFLIMVYFLVKSANLNMGFFLIIFLCTSIISYLGKISTLFRYYGIIFLSKIYKDFQVSLPTLRLRGIESVKWASAFLFQSLIYAIYSLPISLPVPQGSILWLFFLPEYAL